MDQFLKPARPGVEASGIPSEFNKSQIPIQRYRPLVFGDYIQFQLDISGVYGALYTCLCKSFAQA